MKRFVRKSRPPEDGGKTPKIARVNFRVLLCCAAGLAFGIFFYTRVRFGGIKVSDFIFIACLFLLLLRPVSLKRTAAVFLSLLLSAGIGALAVHIYTADFLSGKQAGEYEVSAVVNTFTVGEGNTRATLTHVTLNGERVSGKMQIRVPTETLRAGDEITFTCTLARAGIEQDSYSEYLFANNIRYTATVGEYEISGTSGNFFLRLNTAFYNVLHANMEKDEADVAYALLTGNSGNIDDGLITAVRQGGIAHIFAVSGLHIGILFAAVMTVCRRMGKYRFIPAVVLSLCYCAVCAFTVSSVRAVIMSAVLGAYNAFGRKHDFLNSVSFAAIVVLLLMPAQFLAAGFRLSFGACIGLALFSRPLARLFCKLPRFLKSYLSSGIAVQIFTFPILYETFGYFSVWGLLLNPILVPLLPVLFLSVLACSLAALVISPAGAFFLAFPKGMLSLLLFVFSAVDFSFVLTGFSLGAGALVWLTGSVLLSEKVRMKWKPRALTAAGLAVLFGVCVCLRNVVLTGCKLSVGEGGLVLVQTNRENVLIVNGSGLTACEEFLNRNYGGTLSAVVVTGSDELAGINAGAFLPARVIYAREEIPTGLRGTEVVFGETFSVGELYFRYESPTKLAVFYGGQVAEIDFSFSPALGADLYLGRESYGCTYYLHGGSVIRWFWD